MPILNAVRSRPVPLLRVYTNDKSRICPIKACLTLVQLLGARRRQHYIWGHSRKAKRRQIDLRISRASVTVERARHTDSHMHLQAKFSIAS